MRPAIWITLSSAVSPDLRWPNSSANLVSSYVTWNLCGYGLVSGFLSTAARGKISKLRSHGLFSGGTDQRTLIDVPGPDLVVLVGVEVLLLLAGGILGLARGGLGRGRSSLGRLLGVLLALLLALLQLRLGDALARDLVEVEVGDLVGGRGGRGRRVSHGGRLVVSAAVLPGAMVRPEEDGG
jgi:hypothetical protein